MATESNTALHKAAASGSLEAVQKLLSAGAAPNARTKEGLTPLHVAADRGLIEIADCLLKGGANIDAKTNFEFIIRETQTPLYRAVDNRQVAMVRFLVEQGADVNIVCNTSCDTALTEACKKNLVEVVDFLLSRGANPNGIDHPSGRRYGSFPLYWAISRQVVERLVAAGADVNAVTDDRDTALHWLVRRLNDEVVSSDYGPMALDALAALLESGANPNARDRHGRPPMALAKAPLVLERLLAAQAKAGAGAVDINSSILANLAFDMEGSAVLETLIVALNAASSEAVRRARTDGASLLHLIARSIAQYDAPPLPFDRVREAFRIVLDKGGDINGTEDLWQDTPLHSLVRETLKGQPSEENAEGFSRLMAFLIERGADPSARNGEGARPVDLAEDPAIRDFLLSVGRG